MCSSDDSQVDLGLFRDGVAVLRCRSVVMGHAATIVDSFRGLLPVRQPRVWLLVTWLDGSRERIEEDYPPWTAVAELSNGHLTVARGGQEEDFTIEWLNGADRNQAWQVFGIHEAVEAYM